MNRLLVTLLVVLVLLGVLGWWLFGRRGASGRGEDGAVAVRTGPERVELPYPIYFPGRDGWLHSETRSLSVVRGDLATVVEAVTQSVLSGPEGDDHFRPWPEDTVLLGVVLTPAGTAFIDLGAEGEPDPPAVGSRQETAMIYSLVNSVTLAELEIKNVVLLWNGEQRASFAGHLDTSRPLASRTELLARRAERP